MAFKFATSIRSHWTLKLTILFMVIISFPLIGAVRNFQNEFETSNYLTFDQTSPADRTEHCSFDFLLQQDSQLFPQELLPKMEPSPGNSNS